MAQQRTISARAGTINYQQGAVYVDDQRVHATYGDTPPFQMKNGQRLRIDNGTSVGVFTLASIQKDPLGGIRLNWLSAASQTYVLQRCTNLASAFVDVSTNINATPPLNSYRDASAVGFGPYFYRLRLGP